MPVCGTCAGLGRVFHCIRWPACGCPDGTLNAGCPGETVYCPECDGTGQVLSESIQRKRPLPTVHDRSEENCDTSTRDLAKPVRRVN